MDKLYLIRTRRHKDYFDGLPVWWGPNNAGYTTNPDRAGRYNLEEFGRELKDDYPVKETSILRHRKRYMDNLKRKTRIALDGATGWTL